MPVNLSHAYSQTTGTFFTSIHASMRDNHAADDASPTLEEFATWYRKRFEGASPQAALDVGCGVNAYYARHCQEHGTSKVCALDTNPEAVQAIREDFPELDVTEGTVLELPFDDATFDLCICAGVAHHTPDPERALREIHRVLKPGGVAYITLYGFQGSLFEWIVRGWRLIGKIIPFSVGHFLFKRFPAINNFVLDHSYAPILWVFSRDEVLSMLTRIGFKANDDWRGGIDPTTDSWMGRVLSGDGLIRTFICGR
ncbi:MAG: methyltransferase domain-containing protein [Rhodospirillales bacterium]|nr:methyltransferase domain-containing protein [Rhodospirillales bacterium]